MKANLIPALLLSLAPFLHAAEPPQPTASPTAGTAVGKQEGKWDAKAAFAKRDANGDGVISFEEFKTGRMAQRHPEKAADYFKRKDLDGKGSISFEEFKTRLPESAKPKTE